MTNFTRLLADTTGDEIFRAASSFSSIKRRLSSYRGADFEMGVFASFADMRLAPPIYAPCAWSVPDAGHCRNSPLTQSHHAITPPRRRRKRRLLTNGRRFWQAILGLYMSRRSAWRQPRSCHIYFCHCFWHVSYGLFAATPSPFCSRRIRRRRR